MVGLGIMRQSTANTLDVATHHARGVERINPTLPKACKSPSFDSSVFIEGRSARSTDVHRGGLVVLVIFLFLGSLRAMLMPAVITVPVSLITSTSSPGGVRLFGQSAHAAGAGAGHRPGGG
jgi:multidrug efflux pump